MKTFKLSTTGLLGIAVTAALSGCGGSSSNSDQYAFSTATPDRYQRVDRTGEPAIATALLSRDPAVVPLTASNTILNPGAGNKFNSFHNQRDAFNRGDPVNDARDFAGLLTVGPQSNSLRNIHYKVRPALVALGLTPCSTETKSPPDDSTQVDITTCVNQVAPVVLPDVITYDPSQAAGWPNGRGYDDPVVDRLLAAALLNISGPQAPHNINTLFGVINPKTDETGTPLPASFPHLRPAHP